MSDSLIQAQEKEFNSIQEELLSIRGAAVAEQRDLNEEENAKAQELLTRAHSIQSSLKKLLAEQKSLSETQALFGELAQTATTSPAVHTRAEAPKDASEYFFHFLRAKVDPNPDPMSVRALDTVTSTDSAGLLPYTIQGDIIKFVDAGRRTIDSLQYFSMPAGKTFKRRVLSGAAEVGTHAEGADDVASSLISVAYEDVTPVTYATGMKINLETDEWTSPQAAALNFQSMVEQYAIKTDQVVAAALKAAATNTKTITTDTCTPAQLLRALHQAADTVYSNSKTEADTLWVSLGVKTWLAGMADASDNAAFPQIAPSSTFGTQDRVGALNSGFSIGGLRVVVDPLFANGTMIVGSSKFGEVYETRYPTVQAVSPSTLQREVVMWGRLISYFRAEGFVKFIANEGATPGTDGVSIVA